MGPMRIRNAGQIRYHRPMDLVAAFRVFVCVADTGGFSAAARELGVGQPAVSKQMAALEKHLGARLFNRSSQAFSLADGGLALLDAARVAVEAVDNAQDLARLQQQQVGGLVRIAGPAVFGRTRMLPKLAELVRLQPELELDVQLNDSFIDLAEERVDVALRVGEITDKSLIARPLDSVRRVTIASPQYLERRGEPTHPRDLADHDCIVYTRLATGARWLFDDDGTAVETLVTGPIRVNSSAGVLSAVVAGAGIGVVPYFTLTDEVERGRVRVVLQQFEPKPLPMQLVYLSRRHMPARIRLVIEFLADSFGAHPQGLGRSLRP